MKLRLFTACLPMLPLADIAGWAATTGFDGLEVAAWPAGGAHPHQANHLEVVGFSAEDAARTRALLDEHGLTLSAVSYYENNLIGDADQRQRIHGHLRACTRAASALGVPYVGTFVGRTHTGRSRTTCRPRRSTCLRWSAMPTTTASGSSSRTARWRAGTQRLPGQPRLFTRAVGLASTWGST